jgi:diketogulonate reductase-like aldo/keto reductase
VLHISDGEAVENSVRWALEAGYRHIDTASIYGNEIGVGRAIKESGIPREEIFVTTKVWNRDHGYEQALAAYDASLERLGMDYADLYLVHWPVEGTSKDTYRALETLYNEGRVRAIGVSNFLVHHLEDLLADVSIVPMLNQVEFHPWLQQPDLQALCREQNIRLEAWRPIMMGKVNDIPELIDLGNKYGKSPVQITLRWMIQRGVVTIPKSAQQLRIQSNADIFDFEINPNDMLLIDSLDQQERIGEDPDNFDFDF